MSRILVAGVGNIFLGDDAFGVEVVRRLSGESMPDGVDVVDFGIRGFDLAFALMDDYDAIVLIDTAQRGETPGTLSVIEPDRVGTDLVAGGVDTHNVDPVKVIAFVRQFGVEPENLYVLACEPETFGDELNGAMGLSDTVQATIPDAVALAQSLVNRLIAGPSRV